ncbi:uncharacterized protein LOC112085288 [Eutrema salsugineum]|uniref:uncharacterized protein LOC112085288 n=1 Tax=Eutrema salsugineum TaxID=72664 RepID=UPI000CED1C8B|nr:uncharacterized protein LOC112085288 [Eutrema salsugineum]
MVQDKKCTCKVYDRLQIPCSHALCAADSLGLPHSSLLSEYYKTSTWAATYKEVINPEDDPDDADLPDSVLSLILHPPNAKRPPGRPREKRIPSRGELRPNRIKKATPNKCGHCHGTGHNRLRCTNPI